MHPKFDPTGVRTHDLQIMTVHFHVTEMPSLTTRPSVTSTHYTILCMCNLGTVLLHYLCCLMTPSLNRDIGCHEEMAEQWVLNTLELIYQLILGTKCSCVVFCVLVIIVQCFTALGCRKSLMAKQLEQAFQ